MQCPRGGAELVEYSGGPRLCTCGWRGKSPRAGLPLLLVYLLLQNLAGTPGIGA